ncbi:MAG: polyhydroxyalkanoic acid system family protein [Myxococcaceae bacterium]|nr:polyhydroxyalkanoic acid system family protein [Myxococcaceae bacterium]
MRRALLVMLFATTAFAESEAPAVERAAEGEPFVIDSATAIKMSVGHAFGVAEARERVGYLLDYWGRRFGVKREWRGDRVFLTGSVWGVEIKAVFRVEPHAVFAMAWDPGTMFASAAQRYVRQKLKKYLHPTYDDP